MDILKWKMNKLSALAGCSFVITIFSLYLLSLPNRYAHIVFCGSYILQFYIFLKTKQWFLFFQMVVLFIFAIYNFCIWTQRGVGL
jgi:hypothetical protein